MDREDLIFVEQIKREEKAKQEAEKELNKIIKAFKIEEFANNVLGKTMSEVQELADKTKVPYELGESSIMFEIMEFHDNNTLLFFMDGNKIVDMILTEG